MKSKREIEKLRQQRLDKEKKTYCPPQLTRWGRIKDITKGAGGTSDDGFTGSAGV